MVNNSAANLGGPLADTKVELLVQGMALTLVDRKEYSSADCLVVLKVPKKVDERVGLSVEKLVLLMVVERVESKVIAWAAGMAAWMDNMMERYLVGHWAHWKAI